MVNRVLGFQPIGGGVPYLCYLTETSEEDVVPGSQNPTFGYCNIRLLPGNKNMTLRVFTVAY